MTLTTEDFRIEEARVCTVNGRKVVKFKAFKRDGDAFVHCGQFSAPARTPKRDLWRIAAGLESIKPLGAPRKLDAGRAVNVFLDAASLARAAEFGAGNVSEGIRIALAAPILENSAEE